MSAPLLKLIANPAAETRTTSDRLEILHALIAAPTFDPVLREDVIRIVPDHPVYGWCCPVSGCERSRATWGEFCCEHCVEWSAVQRNGDSIVDFLRKAQPLKAKGTRAFGPCLICPHALAHRSDVSIPSQCGDDLCGQSLGEGGSVLAFVVDRALE
ncbi:hypothetical protein AB0E09_52610, partial [Streptomyces mirabilis]